MIKLRRYSMFNEMEVDFIPIPQKWAIISEWKNVRSMVLM